MPESVPGHVKPVPSSSNLLTLPVGTYCVSVIACSEGVAWQQLPFLQLVVVDAGAQGPGAESSVQVKGDSLLRRPGDAALIWVRSGLANLLLTSVNLSGRTDVHPPEIRLERLGGGSALPVQAASPDAPPPAIASADPDLVVHLRRRGDVGGAFGDWIGEVLPDTWIEGVQLRRPDELSEDAIQYQVTLGKGWLSPWTPAGGFCGTRGMGLPILGFRARLSEEASAAWSVRYAARCVDGTELREVADGDALEAMELKALASLRVILEPRQAARRGQAPGAGAGAGRKRSPA